MSYDFVHTIIFFLQPLLPLLHIFSSPLWYESLLYMYDHFTSSSCFTTHDLVIWSDTHTELGVLMFVRWLKGVPCWSASHLDLIMDRTGLFYY